MSDVLIQSLQEQITRLQGENAELRSEAKSRRIKGKELLAANETLKAHVDTLTTERDGLAASVKAKPGELQAELDGLRGKLRDRDHRDRFRELAKTQGVNEKALDDLWSLSGYKAESDEVDEGKITAAITSTLEGRDWLKAAPASEGANGTAGRPATKTGQAPASETRNPGPGANRGVASGKTDPLALLAEQYPHSGRIA